MEKALSMKRFGVQCTLAVVITVAFYAILYNLKFLPGYLAIFAAGVPALIAALAGGIWWRKEDVLVPLAGATGAFLTSYWLASGHMFSLFFWWQEPGKASIMFLCVLGLLVVGSVCCGFLIHLIVEVPSNWASATVLVLEATAIAFGLSTDVGGRGKVCWDKPTEFGGCAHPLDGYLYCVAILAIVIVFARFAPAPNLEKWRARQERDRAREADRLRAEIAELEATSLR